MQSQLNYVHTENAAHAGPFSEWIDTDTPTMINILLHGTKINYISTEQAIRLSYSSSFSRYTQAFQPGWI